MRKIVGPININTKAKAKKYFQGINFTLISVSTVSVSVSVRFGPPGIWSDRFAPSMVLTELQHTVLGRQWKGTNEQLSPVALFPSTAPNQEPAIGRAAPPPPPNPLPEPYPGVGKGVRILGLNFWFDFFVENVNSVHTRCIVKTSGFTRGVCKNRGFY